jgi:hypothetical protein
VVSLYLIMITQGILNTKMHVQCKSSSFGICGTQNGIRTVFSSGISISCASNNSTIAPEVCAKPDKPITHNSLGTYGKIHTLVSLHN